VKFTLSKESWRILRGLAFISPNVAGFLLFTLVPLALSFFMAFSNWDLQRHNMFRNEPIGFTGLANFLQLIRDPHFWQYLGNTFFLLMGLPFSIAGSLGAALLLHRSPMDKYRGSLTLLWGSGILVGSCFVLAAIGFQASALMILMSGLFGLVLITGIAGGSTVYRTLFYLPHFTQGVAIFILWKKLYNPTSGPINNALAPVIEGIETIVLKAPPGTGSACLLLFVLLILGIWHFGVRSFVKSRLDQDYGTISLLAGTGLLWVPIVLMVWWLPGNTGWLSLAAALITGLAALWKPALWKFRTGCPATRGIGSGLLKGGILLVLQLVLVGIGLVLFELPGWSREGLNPPLWLADYHWAKPSIMIMSLWAAIGSNSMILYLAGLSNISPELYEAADIDGAGKWQKFCHITWPQLAPVTFFIVIMSFIYGLQGGFEMARTMTKGGPAGATTTLSYFVYTEGFETGRLGYASAVAWTLFLLVFVATLFNWRFGNRYVAD
jgi:multiple sugar transport system permease protein